MPPEDEELVAEVVEGPVPPGRAVVVWRPPEEDPEKVRKRAADAKLARAREARALAAEAAAEAQIKLMAARGVIADLVTKEMKKYLELAQHPDFANAVGPLSPEMILKLAEWASKENRLDAGKATEHVAHIVAPAIDFSQMTQEDRNAWRTLAIKYGIPDE